MALSPFSVVGLAILFLGSFSFPASASMVVLKEVRNSYIVDGSLTKDQLEEAIMKGAQTAGWLTKDLVGDRILATYRIRVHTVHVEISYTDSFYVVRYTASNGMKMFCTTRDKEKIRDLKVSGRQECLGGRAPMYINGNYKQWMGSLNAAIQNALASQGGGIAY
jgi:hypothetical protein